MLGIWNGLDRLLSTSGSEKLGGDAAISSEVAVPFWSGALTPTLGAISRLLESGSAITGDVVKGEEGLLEVGSWDLAPEATLARIEAKWRELAGSPRVDKIVWLELTDRGRAVTSDSE